jgi:Na+/glutamate symporter
MLALDLVNTIAIAGVVLFASYGLRRIVPVLARLNIPAPVVGGLIVAIAMTVAHTRGSQLLRFDTTLQTSLQNAFFTSIGFGASVQLLRLGGSLVIRFFLFATAIAILQNVVGAAVAIGLGQGPLLGVLAESVTLTGGPATGLAFSPLFEQAGVQGADTVGVAAAMSQQTLDDLGNVALSLFLALALMTLRLWELAGLAVPLTLILAVQVALVAIVAALAVPRVMGRDYESIVMGRRLRRVHARHQRQCHGEYECARGAIRARAKGVPHGSSAGSVLHRFHQCCDHHHLSEPMGVMTAPVATTASRPRILANGSTR